MRKQGSRGDAEGGGNAKIICIGFYSRGFASLAGKGGFAADLGRFGETPLPFFSMGADALPPEGPRGATPSSLFFLLRGFV